MRIAAFFFLAAAAFLLGGCSQMPSQAFGAQGLGAPLPLEGEEPLPRAVLPQRPMRRRRRNAALGRSVPPGENAACNGCGGSAGCDYPAWLFEAQKQNGLYIGLSAQAAALDNVRQSLPLVFSPAGFAAAANSFLAPLTAQRRGQAAQGSLPALLQKTPSWGGLFADWCFTHAVNPKTGRFYAGPAKGVAVAENWLHYGIGSEACLGALMLARQGDTYFPAFCVGALSVPVHKTAGGEMRRETVYLGLGAKAGASPGFDFGSRIGFVAFAAADIAAFRLPQGYQPCKEHFKLEHTPWAELFREKIRLRQQREQNAAAKTAAQPQEISAKAAPAKPAEQISPAGQRSAEPRRFSADIYNNVFDEGALQAAIERDLSKQDFGQDFAQDYVRADFAGRAAGGQSFGRPPRRSFAAQ